MAVTPEKAKELLGSFEMNLVAQTFYQNEDMKDTIIMAINAIDDSVKYKKLLENIDTFEKQVLTIDSDKMSGEDILNYVCQLIEILKTER